MYARLYGVAPHDPALDHISECDLDVYIEAAFEFENVLRGKPRISKGSLAEKVADAEKRFKRRAESAEQVPVTPKELGWEV